MHSVKKPIKKRIKRSSMGVNVSSSIGNPQLDRVD